ncbi:hypothetical protein L6164_000226 [Bauhinia variegata]|uniref:Uncharacterized protein n=1 Tax=Bauhinia variegata TaxID=167791 RepID=A0ACB9Q7B9_BAUVA|nr:hypothetical protein L6164_000226 [Bauhinia variegata]
MHGGGSENLTLQAWLESSASIDNSNEGDGGDHADSGPVSSAGQTHWLYKVPETPQEAAQRDEAGEGGERPRSELPKGFYDSQWVREDIQTENLIKWLDRPNAANSWDPLKDIRNVPDLNDLERCKDNQGDQNTQPQWLQRSIAPCSLRGLSTSGTDNQQQSISAADVEALPQDNDPPTLTTRGTLNSNQKISTAAPTVEVFNDFQQLRNFGNFNDSSVFYGASMGNRIERVQNERPRGAKKRKSGPVKRFIKAPLEFEPVQQANTAVACRRDNYDDSNLETVDENNLDIVKIISPIHYVPPRETTTGTSFIIFLALRSNGEETLVSNRSLRESNPKLGQKQFLIKWFDWPKKNNIWECLTNLRNVGSLIDAIEESIKYPQLRKRRGKRVAQNKQIKRHQVYTTAFRPRWFAPLANVGNAKVADLSEAMASTDGADSNSDATIHRNKGQIAHKMEEDDFDSVLLELEASSNMRAAGVDANGLAINVQNWEGKPHFIFEILRSDGTTATVTNDFLMESNYKLLAKYYEQYLRSI